MVISVFGLGYVGSVSHDSAHVLRKAGFIQCSVEEVLSKPEAVAVASGRKRLSFVPAGGLDRRLVAIAKLDGREEHV